MCLGWFKGDQKKIVAAKTPRNDSSKSHTNLNGKTPDS